MTASSGTHPAIGFQGGWTNPGSGLVNAEARWYDPVTGAFTAQDSLRPAVGAATATNLYGYGPANPVSYADPSGHLFGGLLHGIAELSGDAAHAVMNGGRAMAAVAEEAGAAVESAGLAEGLLASCSRFCEFIPYVGWAAMTVATGYRLYQAANAGGNGQPALQPGTVTTPRTGGQQNPEGCQSQPSAGVGSAGCATRAPPPPPPAPAPVYVTGTKTVTNGTTTRSHWFDDSYIYDRTDRFSYTTTYHWTYFSNGAWTEHWAPGLSSHIWTVVWRPIQDWSNPLRLSPIHSRAAQPPAPPRRTRRSAQPSHPRPYAPVALTPQPSVVPD